MPTYQNSAYTWMAVCFGNTMKRPIKRFFFFLVKKGSMGNLQTCIAIDVWE